MFILEADTKRLLLVSGPPSPLTEGLDASKKDLSEKQEPQKQGPGDMFALAYCKSLCLG